MKRYLFSILFILSGIFVTIPYVNAQTDNWEPVKPNDQSSLLKKYKNFAVIQELNIVVPTVVELSVTTEDAGEGMTDVFNNTTREFVYSSLSLYQKPGPNVVTISSSTNVPGTNTFFDDKTTTGGILYLNGKNSESVDFTVDYTEAFQSTSINLFLGDNSPLPVSITISAEINGSMKTLVNNKSLTSSKVSFPSITAKKWYIKITYNQPFRLNEISISNTAKEISRKTVRFLALPGNSYSVYSNTEKSFNSGFSWNNYPDLNNAKTIKSIGFVSLFQNPSFKPSDMDSDGVVDSIDNCPSLANENQEDLNKNNIGDVCDDFDLDGVMNSTDNCPDKANLNQKDTDGDKIGDLCDPDESRLTEKYPFVVWVGIGFATLIFLVLLFVAGNKIRKNNLDGDVSNNPQPPVSTPQL